MGVERWFEREHSHLRGRVKNHPDRSNFSVDAGDFALAFVRGAARRQPATGVAQWVRWRW